MHKKHDVGNNDYFTRPIASTQDEAEQENELINILPSYQMYQSTISKTLTPTTEDLRIEPPSYEISPVTSGNSSIDRFPESFSPLTSDSELGTNEEGNTYTRWDDTILANAHKLKRLTSNNKYLSKSLSISIHFTENIGKVGIEPKMVDLNSLELKQGDYIYGYVLINNKTEFDIPFDMLSVVLEGSVTFAACSNSTVVNWPVNITKFLTMFDFNASWNDACLDRLVSDHNNPHETPGHDVIRDPLDNTILHLNHKKFFEPFVTYKKFFTFRLPEKLLDYSCESHRLIKHLQIPPTLGVSKYEIISKLRNKWTSMGEDESKESSDFDVNVGSFTPRRNYASVTQDLSFPDTSISYSISVRVIGKASDYRDKLIKNPIPHLNPSSSEYVVANESYEYIRVIPVTDKSFEMNRDSIVEESRLLYSNLVSTIEQKIQEGKALGSCQANDTLSTEMSNVALSQVRSGVSLAKMRQSYNNFKPRFIKNKNYEAFFKYNKKTMFGSKPVGMIVLSSPKVTYKIPYKTITQYRQANYEKPPSILSIPIDISFMYTDVHKTPLPEFKKVSVELIACTVRSKKLPIPFVLDCEMFFEDKSKGNDITRENLVKKFQRYSFELTRLLKEHGNDALEIDKETAQSVKCLANLDVKTNHFKVADPYISPRDASDDKFKLLTSIPWQEENLLNSESKSDKTVKYSKKFNLNIDVHNVVTPTGSEEFTLVPCFQICHVCRLYYLRVSMKYSKTDKVVIKLPLVLQQQK